jgi:tetratricopeptide (TPR) repeat protein
MIVRDEEANLPQCLRGVAGLMDEIIIVDTGSTDGTREIATQAGAVVVSSVWQDDFSAARNEGLRHARSDWIFWLDADERIDEVNIPRLRSLFAGLGEDNVVHVMRCISMAADGVTPVILVDNPRVFQRRQEIRWCYRVHEQVLPSILRAGARMQFSDVVLHHSGYADEATRRRKDERNLRLLRLDRAERPDDHSVCFHLGMTLVTLDQPAEAISHLEQGLRFAPAGDPTIRKAHALITQALRRLGRHDDALASCGKGLEQFPGDTELLFQASVICAQRRDLTGAERCLVRLLNTPAGDHLAIAVDPDLRGVKAQFNLGVVYREQGRLADAEAQWRKVLAARPGHTDTRLALADLYLGLDRRAEAERLALDVQRDPRCFVDATALWARIHLHARDFNAALAVLDDGIARAPHAVSLRVTRSHVLLAENRDPAAAEQALRDVLAIEPTNLQARNNLAWLLAQLQQGRKGTAP